MPRDQNSFSGPGVDIEDNDNQNVFDGGGDMLSFNPGNNVL